MRVVLQRVKEASVTIEGQVVDQIGQGYLLLVGFGPDDTEETLDYMVHKITNLRVFESEPGKMNLGLKDVDGAILSVSQFTLYADVKHGNRPGFTDAGDPEKAKELYEYMIDSCRREIPVVEQGEFGADMKVELVNDGPFTILLDSEIYREKKK